MIIQSRRNFITGLTSLLAAPAIVRAGSLMPVRNFFKITNYDGIITTELPILYGSLEVKVEWLSDMMIYGAAFEDELGERVDQREVFNGNYT